MQPFQHLRALQGASEAQAAEAAQMSRLTLRRSEQRDQNVTVKNAESLSPVLPTRAIRFSYAGADRVGLFYRSAFAGGLSRRGSFLETAFLWT